MEAKLTVELGVTILKSLLIQKEHYFHKPQRPHGEFLIQKESYVRSEVKKTFVHFRATKSYKQKR